MLSRLAVLLFVLLALLVLLDAGCAGRGGLPRDAGLETFVRVSAQCVYADRAYSKEPDLLKEELRGVEFPADWQQLVDSLVKTHGGNPGFWYDVYTRIVERSRK